MAAPDTRNWLLTVAYDGTAYRGWQIQPDQPTVQGVLQDKLARLYRQPLPTFGTSRTDSGVHALDQRVTVEVPRTPPIPVPNVREALNNALPDDIRVRAIDEMPTGFHARYHAVGKAYTYLLHRGRLGSPFLGRYAWPITSQLDIARMREAAAGLIGTHDFTAFSVTPADQEAPDPVRTLSRIEISEAGTLVMITVIGHSFLYKMVRRIIGFLVAVGRGRLAPADAGRILAERNRNAGFDTAVAQGLFLDRVFFDEAAMDAYRRQSLPFLDFLDAGTP